jgi:hypothetical protein
MDMTSFARAMGNTDVLKQIAPPGQTYSPVDSAVRYLKHWTVPAKEIEIGRASCRERV